jgi:hypothetical protein
MRTDQWHFARPRLASSYLELLDLGLSSARTLFARRRMGKTEFLQQDLAPAAAKAGYLTAYVNLWEDREEPAGALVAALYTAIEPDWMEQLLKRAKAPLKRLKASGRLHGVGEGSIEAELSQDEKHYVGTLLSEVMRAFDKQTKPLLLVIDEAQVLALSTHADFAHALRAALDIRKDRLKVVFAGSSESTLRSMFARPSEPFYNWAPLEPFPLLGREFIEFMVEQTNGIAKNQLSMKHGLLAFERLNQTPEFFRRFLERYLTYPFDGAEAAIEYTREHVFHDGHFAVRWKELLPADRAVLSLLASGETDFHSIDARTKIGTALGVDKAVSMNTPAHALRRLQKRNLVTKLAHGEYQFEDEAFAEWVHQASLEKGTQQS